MSRTVEFRVYPESVHGFYFHCFIYPSRKAFNRGIKTRGSRNDDNMRAIVQYIRYVSAKNHYNKQLGYINLRNGDLDSEVISHESGHAALFWAHCMKIDIYDRTATESGLETRPDCGEERFCYALGRISAQISEKLWDHKLVKGR